MKKSLFTLLIAAASSVLNAQVVFCPPGAEWHYTWYDVPFGQTIANKTIKYTGDTIEGPDTLKILTHTKFFTLINMVNPVRTFIKQKGDTIFMRNSRTQNAWQVLYNFNAQPGQSWSNSLLPGGINGTTTAAYATTVTSITYTTINGFTLKQLHVNHSGYNNHFSFSDVITERIGSSVHLFPFQSLAASDGDYILSRLCYQDSAFGLLQYSAKPCDFSNPVGLREVNEKNELNIYPIPASTVIQVEVSNKIPSYTQGVQLIDALGRVVKTKQLLTYGKLNLDVHALQSGIYFVQLFEEGKLIATQKVIKE